jgi:GNAT superfamily N-acetyltransferase
MTQVSPSADVSVREATTADVSAIAEVQVTTWRQAYGNILPRDVLDGLDPAAIEARWADSIALPGAGHALVALEAGRAVGVAAASRATDPDQDPATTAEVGPLLVLPEAQGRGHGSRLLAAAVDLLRADGVERAVCWVFQGDSGAQTFYETAGWALDGVSRDLDAAGTLVREVRLHTDLTPEPEPTLDDA